LVDKNSEKVNPTYEMSIEQVDSIAGTISGHTKEYHCVLEGMSFEDEEMGIGA